MEKTPVIEEKRYMGSRAMADVLRERHRQIHMKGHTSLHDDTYTSGELALAAAAYAGDSAGKVALTVKPPKFTQIVLERAAMIARAIWPWDKIWYKPEDHRHNCVVAAALLVAEIERIDRAEEAALAKAAAARTR